MTEKFLNTVEQQTNDFYAQAKIYNYVQVYFYKSARENAKLLKNMTISLRKYEPLNLTGFIEQFILLNKKYRKLNVVIKFTQSYCGCGGNRYYTGARVFTGKCYTIEQFINELAEACVLASNGVSLQYLAGIHHNNTIRQYINKYYNDNNN